MLFSFGNGAEFLQQGKGRCLLEVCLIGDAQADLIYLVEISLPWIN